jgi:hypothetical protein
LPACVSDECGGNKGHHFHKADHEQQHPESPFLTSNKAFSDETTTEQELYRIVKALSDSMTLASRLAISDSSKTNGRIGEFVFKITTLVNIKAASRKLMPLHIERTIEPLFSILLSPYDVY